MNDFTVCRGSVKLAFCVTVGEAERVSDAKCSKMVEWGEMNGRDKRGKKKKKGRD